MSPHPGGWLVCWLAYWLGLATLAAADETPAITDCHVHLWDIARPAGLGWIKKDDKTLARSFLPADHEPIARAHGVTGIIVVQAGQSLPIFFLRAFAPFGVNFCPFLVPGSPLHSPIA